MIETTYKDDWERLIEQHIAFSIIFVKSPKSMID